METICLMRQLYRALERFEAGVVAVHGVCINEAMVLSSLSGGKLAVAEIARCNGMSASHTSKVIASVERSGLVKRVVGEHDKRKMYFELTATGRRRLSRMRCGSEYRTDLRVH